MSELHQLQILSADQTAIESVDQAFLAFGQMKAREKTIEVVQAIRTAFYEGLTENEARLLALKIFREHGVTKHWHQPYIRFGEGTVLSFNDPISENHLALNDSFHLDVGPVWPSKELGITGSLEYEGDYGDTYIFGQNKEAEKIISDIHEIFDLAKAKWKEESLPGAEIYQFCKQESERRGYSFIENVQGHRLSDFPHQKYTKKKLSQIDFTPTNSLWILELMIVNTQQRRGAFYEDLMV